MIVVVSIISSIISIISITNIKHYSCIFIHIVIIKRTSESRRCVPEKTSRESAGRSLVPLLYIYIYIYMYIYIYREREIDRYIDTDI